MYMTNDRLSHRTLHILLIAVIVAVGLCFTALQAPAFAAKTPSKVSGVEILSVGDYSFTASWHPAKNALSYEVQYKKASAKKWPKSGIFTSNDMLDVNVKYADTKYQVRIRGINGNKRGSWSSVKSLRTTLPKPKAIWAKSITNSVIELQWLPMSGVKEYKLTWCDEAGDELDHVFVKGTSYKYTGIGEVGETMAYHFELQSKSGKKYSVPVFVDLNTFDDDNYLEQHDYPFGVYYTMKYFETDVSFNAFPVLYDICTDDCGDVEDEGFFYPEVEVETFYFDKDSGVLSQDYGEMEKPITSELTLQKGGTVTAPDGSVLHITKLRISANTSSDLAKLDYYYELRSEIKEPYLRIDTKEDRPIYITWTAD